MSDLPLESKSTDNSGMKRSNVMYSMQGIVYSGSFLGIIEGCCLLFPLVVFQEARGKSAPPDVFESANTQEI